MARTKRVEIPITATDKATRTIKRVQGSLRGLAGTASTVMGSLTGLGSVAGVAGLTMLARSAISAGSAITDMATATQTGVEELQALTFAARDAGASNEQMAALLVRAQKSANDAARGLSTAKDAFAKLGINVEKFIDLAPERKLEVLGRAIVKADGDTRAYGAALDLLGTRNAPKLMEVLQRLGTEGFDSISVKARKANQIMSEETAQSLDRAADNIERFKNSSIIFIGDIIGYWNDLLGKMGESKAMIKELEDAVAGGAGLMGQFLPRIQGAETAQEAADILDELKTKLTELDQAFTKTRRGGYFKGVAISATEVAEVEAQIVTLQRLIQISADAQNTPLVNQRTGELIGETTMLLRDMETQALLLGDTFSAGFNPEPVITFADSLRGWVAPGFENVKTVVTETADNTVNNFDLMGNAARAFATGLENGLANAATQGKAAFGDMAQFVLAEIQRILIRMLLFRTFMGLGFSGFAQNFAPPEIVTPPQVTPPPTSTVIGGLAGGGPAKAGRSYIVGERGPEMITMGANGYVTPNHRMGGPTFNVDMRGASLEAVQRLEQFVAAMNGTIEQRSVRAVQDAFSRQPSYMRR